MATFPKEKIQPILCQMIPDEPGKSHPYSTVSLYISIKPFELPGVDTVDSDLVLDGVILPTTDLRALAGQTFTYPTNPKDGYIDASWYILHAHHLLDVTEIHFGPLQKNEDGETMLNVTFTMVVVLTFEGLQDANDEDYDDVPLVFTCPLVKRAKWLPNR